MGAPGPTQDANGADALTGSQRGVTRYVVGVDVGGTKIVALLLDERGAIQQRRWVEHEIRSDERLIADVCSVVDGLVAAAQERNGVVVVVGVSIAAWLSADRRQIRLAANLASRDESIASDLAREIGRQIVVENDGNAAALAESRRGAGANSAVLVFIALGTGVGGGIVIDGRPLTGATGGAGELGHLRVADVGVECVCGARDCLELVASGPGIARVAGTSSSEHAAAAARAGDRRALDAFDTAARGIARTIAAVAAIVDPELVVLGGTVALAASDLLLPTVINSLADDHPLARLATPPPVMLATLGADAAAIGAAELALDALAGTS